MEYQHGAVLGGYAGAVLARKMSWGHGPRYKGQKGVWKMPYFSTEISHLYTKSCKNERAKMKESRSRQNDK